MAIPLNVVRSTRAMSPPRGEKGVRWRAVTRVNLFGNAGEGGSAAINTTRGRTSFEVFTMLEAEQRAVDRRRIKTLRSTLR